MPGLHFNKFFVWYTICCFRSEKNAIMQRIRKKYTYEMDKLNAQNYMKCFKNVLKKCLKVCGQAIYIAGINDGRVKIEEKIV